MSEGDQKVVPFETLLQILVAVDQLKRELEDAGVATEYFHLVVTIQGFRVTITTSEGDLSVWVVIIE